MASRADQGNGAAPAAAAVANDWRIKAWQILDIVGYLPQRDIDSAFDMTFFF